MHALLWVPLFFTLFATGIGQCHTGPPTGRVSPWNHYTTSLQCLVMICTHSPSLVFISFPIGIENISESLSIVNMCATVCHVGTKRTLREMGWKWISVRPLPQIANDFRTQTLSWVMAGLRERWAYGGSLKWLPLSFNSLVIRVVVFI